MVHSFNTSSKKMNRCLKPARQQKKYLTPRRHKHFDPLPHMRTKSSRVSPLTCRAGRVGNNLSITGQYKRCSQMRCHSCVWLYWWTTRLEDSVFRGSGCILFHTIFAHTVDEHGGGYGLTGAFINCDTRGGIQDCGANPDAEFLPRWNLLGHKFRLLYSRPSRNVYPGPSCCVCAR